MRALKVVFIALGACVLALGAAALFVVASWSRFEAKPVVGCTMEDSGEDLAQLTEDWLLD